LPVVDPGYVKNGRTGEIGVERGLSVKTKLPIIA
jgi:hypothetical protein